MGSNRAKKKEILGWDIFSLGMICGGIVDYSLAIPFFCQSRDDFRGYLESGGMLLLVPLVVVIVTSVLSVIKPDGLNRKAQKVKLHMLLCEFLLGVLLFILVGAFSPIIILSQLSTWAESHFNNKKRMEKHSVQNDRSFDSTIDKGNEFYDAIPTVGKELEDFLVQGDTFILPAVNSTHLYLELKKVYKEWSEDFIRYLALRITSFAANDKIPDDVLVELVGLYSEESWHDLCIAYTWEWAFCVGGIDENSIPMSLSLTADTKVETAIKRAEKFIMAGNKRYEFLLRSIPKSKIKQELVEFRTMWINRKLKNDLV